MSIEEIRHLDNHETSPFDVICSLDDTISLIRLALQTQLRMMTIDAVRSSSEQYLADAFSYLYNAREALVACVEDDGA